MQQSLNRLVVQADSVSVSDPDAASVTEAVADIQSVADATGMTGQIDTIRPDGEDLLLRGWLWNANEPDRRMTLQVGVSQSNMISSVVEPAPLEDLTVETVADLFRPDLVAGNVGDGGHAFECRLPGAAMVAPGLLRIHCPENGYELICTGSTEIGSSLALWPPTVLREDGVLCGVSFKAGVLRGWVEDEDPADGRGNGAFPRLTIQMDGRDVWTGLAQRRETIMRRGIACEVRSGFLVDLPEPERPTRTIEVSITDARGRHLAGSPMTLRYGDQYAGQVDSLIINGTRIEANGWCGNRRNPTSPIGVAAYYDDEKVVETTSLLPRPDLQKSGFDPAIGGFALSWDLPESFDRARLQIRPEHSGWPLPVGTVQTATEIVVAGPEPVVFGGPNDEINGSVDVAVDRLLRGWARNKTTVGALVVLDLFVNGILYATTTARRFRGDLKAHFNDHGCHEFLFELTPALMLDAPCSLEVVPRQGKSAINNKIPMLERSLPRRKVISPRDPDFLKRFRPLPFYGVDTVPSISLIVINRNGADLLRSFFTSFARFNSYNAYEIVIIDHNSTDDSEQVVELWMKRLKVRWMQRGGNYSFSDSNNVGARACDTELVLFINNDVSFTMDCLGRVASYMRDPDLGCLGIQLLDESPLKRPDRQSAIQHLGIHFDPTKGKASDAFESRYAGNWESVANGPVEVPAVTGAFMVCRREEFLRLGGFETAYYYGHEDVDLALKFQLAGRRIVCANDITLLHMRAYSRDRMSSSQNTARQRNRDVLDDRFGFWIRDRTTQDRFTKPAFWNSMPVRIAFVVTEATDITLAGDYFTALELAAQLSAQFACECSFLETIVGNQFDLAGYDVVVAMRDDYNPANIKNPAPHLIKVAWVRNWFDRFGNRPSAPLFDRVWASSQEAVAHLTEHLDKPVQLMPIATNQYRFEAGKPDPALRSDYCFTGSYWGVHREIIQMLQPSGLPFDCAIYGSGWENVPHLAPHCRGILPYKRMPEVYASTRIVIDDANHVTKNWGSVNSRVFDAIASGALVLTNGIKGSRDSFGGALPTYDTVQTLEALLWKYLSDEPARIAKVRELQRIVRTQHTYLLRARTAWEDFGFLSRSQVRMSIKIGAPNEKTKAEWGDWHFAVSMKREFERLGHTVRIDCLDAWESQAGNGDEVVIVLRGLSSYKPKSSQINVMWCISHPNRISIAEYESYDHVFIASELYAETLRPQVQVPVSVLLQCTDPRLFNPDVPRLEETPEVLFVGNSRNEYRRIVRDALEQGLPLEVYGSRWEGFIPEHVTRGTYIDNSKLASYYASARILLNDHWASMAAAGFISNRLFDALACGARIITDEVPGMEELFGPLVRIYREADDLPRLVEDIDQRSAAEADARLELANTVMREHSFRARVRDMMVVFERIRAQKMAACEALIPMEA